MRPLSLLLPAALLMPGTAALAQHPPYPPPDSTPISTVQVTAPVKSMRILPSQADELKGAYLMSNGWRLTVRPTSRFIHASIDMEKPIRLHQVERDRFVSGDGNVTMQFNQGQWREDMTMTYVPDRRLAQAVVISSRLARR